MPRVALVTGANGTSGRALLEHLIYNTTNEQWSRIVVTSRSALRSKITDPRVQFVQLDFRQRPGELIDLMSQPCADVSHAFFSAYVHAQDSVDLDRANATLFENFLLALTSVARGLERCVLQTSSRHYGLHLAPVPTPCREEDPRRGENVHHAQEDFLAMLQTNQNWTWNVVRPEAIVGSTSSPGGVNTALTMAIYLLITRELAEEARLPTNQRYWNGSASISDAALLAEFMVWIATTDECANEAFNFANGDQLTWRFMWPRLAEIFGAYSTPDQVFTKPEPEMGALQQEFSLVEWVASKRPVWHRICEGADMPEAKETLDSANWQSLDWMLQRSWSCSVSMNKARKMGWTGFVDSFDCFSSAFAELRRQHRIP